MYCPPSKKNPRFHFLYLEYSPLRVGLCSPAPPLSPTKRRSPVLLKRHLGGRICVDRENICIGAIIIIIIVVCEYIESDTHPRDLRDDAGVPAAHAAPRLRAGHYHVPAHPPPWPGPSVAWGQQAGAGTGARRRGSLDHHKGYDPSPPPPKSIGVSAVCICRLETKKN